MRKRSVVPKWLWMAPALAGCLWSGQAAAWGEDTHQHITELAFAYLKANASCQPISLTSPDVFQACQADCKTRYSNQFTSESGYTCTCAELTCGPRCDHLEDFARYECVSDCMRHGDGALSCPRDNCLPPYYWDKDVIDDIAVTECSAECYEATELIGDHCAPYAAAQSSE